MKAEQDRAGYAAKMCTAVVTILFSSWTTGTATLVNGLGLGYKIIYLVIT